MRTQFPQRRLRFGFLFPAWFVLLSSARSVEAGEAAVVTEFQRNAPGWRSAEPRWVGYAFDFFWPGRGISQNGCNVEEGDPTAPRTLTLIDNSPNESPNEVLDYSLNVTSKNSVGQNVCPFVDGTSQDRTSDVILENGGEVTFRFSPAISAFYTNYGSLAAGRTCTMRLYAGEALVDSITSAVSSDNGAAAGHGFDSPVLIDEIRFTCTEEGTVLIGAFRGTLGNQDKLGEVCAAPCPAEMDFAVVFEGDLITVSLPGLDDANDEVMTIPKGRTIYALLVSGYAQNENLNLLHFFKFANYVLKQGGYVHYSWWNNLLAPYMERPLHDEVLSHPGDLQDQLGGFVPVPGPDGYFNKKAEPEEDYQFQSDAKKFLAAVHDAEPTALLVVAGHSMGGGAVARLGSDTTTYIDLLAPIDPVGNRSLPVGRVNTYQYNWTRWRAIQNNFLGYKDQDCDRIPFVLLCKLPLDCSTIGDWHDSPPGLAGGWLVREPLCGAYVHNPSTRGLSHVRNLYHRWQTEAPFPMVDYDENRHFNFTSPGGRSVQSPVDTCDSNNDPIDPSINCTGNDGHGEIVGFRHIPPNMIEDGVKATDWTSDPATRKRFLEEWETEGDSWRHRPTTPDLCLVSDGMINELARLITYDDAALVAENERRAHEWKDAVPGRWEAYTFDQFWPSPSPTSFTGCTISGQPDLTAPRTLQLNGGQVTVSALDKDENPICPINDRTSLARASDLTLPPEGKAIMQFDPPIGAFYVLYGSLEEARNARMDLYAGDELVDVVISPASPAAAESVLAIGHGFVSPRLIDRIEFTATEMGGNVLVGALRGVASSADSLGQVCLTAYSANCSSPIDYDFAVVFGPGPVVNQTQPGELFYYTLQGAMEGGRDGDVIAAPQGVYFEKINFLGKAITLRGADSPSAGGGSTIDPSVTRSQGSVVTFASGEGPGSVLERFTITGGNGTIVSNQTRGGGIYVNAASPTVKNCRIIHNQASRGGGVYAVGGEPVLVSVEFLDNRAQYGAGFLGVSTEAALTNCLWAENHSTNGHGGAIVVENESHVTLTNSTVAENSATGSYGGGVLVETQSNFIATNSIFWNNDAGSTNATERQIFNAHGGASFVTFSVIQDNNPGTGGIPFGGATNGNIDLNPRFVDATTGDFRLGQTSPCIDAGNDASVPPDRVDLDADADVTEPTPLDLDGRPRMFHADVGDFAFADMGAYEFAACRADFDANGAINLTDHDGFVDCLNGEGGQSPSCRYAFDFDSDGDVDLFDFRIFQLNFGCEDF